MVGHLRASHLKLCEGATTYLNNAKMSVKGLPSTKDNFLQMVEEAGNHIQKIITSVNPKTFLGSI